MKKMLEHIFYSFLIMVIGFVFSVILASLVGSESSDLKVIIFLTLYLIGIVGFFGIRIIYLLQSRNTTSAKKDEEPF